MSATRILHISLTGILLFSLIIVKNFREVGLMMASTARVINEDILRKSADFDAVLLSNDQNLVHLNSTVDAKANKLLVQSLANKAYTFFIYRADTLVYWNNNNDLPRRDQIDSIKMMANESLVETSFGIYFLLKRKLGDHEVACLIPIKYLFGSNKAIRLSNFPASATIPSDVQLHSGAGAHQLVSASGRSFAHITALEGIKFVQTQRLELVLFLAFIMLYFSLVYNIATEMSNRRGLLYSALFMILGIAAFYTLKIGLGITDGFTGESAFAFSLDTVGSLGDLLLHLLVALWLMVFFHEEDYRNLDKSKAPLVFRMVMAGFFYLAVMLSLLLSMHTLNKLVRSSSVVLDFDNLFNLDIYNLMLILGVILMMAAMFLFGHKLVGQLSNLGLTWLQRLYVISIACVINAIIYVSAFHFPGIHFLVIFAFTITYVLVFDNFVKSDNREFYWVLIWIFLYSMCAAFALYYSNSIKDIEVREIYARRLAVARDSVAEAELPRLQVKLDQLTASEAFQKSFVPSPGPTPYKVILEQVQMLVPSGSYLNLYHTIDVAVVKPDKSLELDRRGYNNGYSSAYLIDSLMQGDVIDPNQSYRGYGNTPRSYEYVLKSKTYLVADRTHPLDVYLTLTPKSTKNSQVYHNVFFDRQYRALPNIDRYDIAIFENRLPVYQKGRIDEDLYSATYFPQKNEGYNHLSQDSTRTDYLYTDKSANVTTVVGRTKGGLSKIIYLASGIFTVLCIFMLFLALLNTYFKFLPAYYKFYIEAKGSLSKRIQYYTIFIILVALSFVGALTYHSFKDSSRIHEIVKNDYLSGNMKENIMQELQKNPGKHVDSQLLIVSSMLPQFMKLYNHDIDLYGRDGYLVSSSAEDLKLRGLLQEFMGMSAFHHLSNLNSSDHISEEKTSGIPFQRRYYALRTPTSQTIGYIGVPYFLPKHNINPANSDFVGKVLTVFVCLLIGGVFFTHQLTGGIIKPLETIISYMKTQRIMEQHVPIVVDSYGEELVLLAEEYNNAILKIKSLIVVEAERERENAWREMANIGAHEIKNALTTLKLSMQSAVHAKETNNQVGVDRYWEKAIYRNLMQIETLSKIAKDFGKFSTNQVTEKVLLDLNKTVIKNYECFEDEKNVSYSLELPDHTVYTMGDTESFTRIIHNLMINAKEAIPDDRHKYIAVSLSVNGTKCFLKVIDNGTGIPEDRREEIFKPRFTSKTSGTGLGLSIIKKIVDEVGGSIYYTSKLDVGTEFTIELNTVTEEERAMMPDDSAYF
jgi:two-component system, NtrC family, nitrogen regulation sensor histidine kinase NtrY